MYRIHKIQSTELKKLNKLKCPSENISVSHGMEKKAITRWEGRRGLGGKVDLGWKVAFGGEHGLVLGEGKGPEP